MRRRSAVPYGRKPAQPLERPLGDLLDALPVVPPQTTATSVPPRPSGSEPFVLLRILIQFFRPGIGAPEVPMAYLASDAYAKVDELIHLRGKRLRSRVRSARTPAGPRGGWPAGRPLY